MQLNKCVFLNCLMYIASCVIVRNIIFHFLFQDCVLCKYWRLLSRQIIAWASLTLCFFNQKRIATGLYLLHVEFMLSFSAEIQEYIIVQAHFGSMMQFRWKIQEWIQEDPACIDEYQWTFIVRSIICANYLHAFLANSVYFVLWKWLRPLVAYSYSTFKKSNHWVSVWDS